MNGSVVDIALGTVKPTQAIGDKPMVWDGAENRHNAASWNRDRRAEARIEATHFGITSVEWGYDSLHCARGQAEN